MSLEDDILAAIRAADPNEAEWKAFTYESEPYCVSRPKGFIERFAVRLIQARTSAPIGSDPNELPTIEATRADFERLMECSRYPVTRWAHDGREYRYERTEAAWIGWQRAILFMRGKE